MTRIVTLLAALIATTAHAAVDCSVDSGSAAHSAGSSITVAPAGGAASSGEVIYLALDYVADTAGMWPSAYSLSGFAHITEINNGGGDGSYGELNLWRKVAGGSEPANYTVGWTGGSLYHAVASLIVCSGVDTTTPEGAPVTAPGSSGTVWDIPALTTVANNSVDLAIVGSNGDSQPTADFSDWGSSLVERIDYWGGNDYAGIGMATAVRATAGLQAATTVAVSATNGYMAIRVEVFEAVMATGKPVFHTYKQRR